MSVVLVPPTYPPGLVQYILVGESPGQAEESRRRMFVGSAGSYMRRVFLELGVDLAATAYLTTVLRVRPPANRAPTEIELISWLPDLGENLHTVRYLHGAVVVAVGATAHHALTLLEIPHTHIYHPAYVSRRPDAYDEWIRQIRSIPGFPGVLPPTPPAASGAG